ncbi:H-NS histone family protein [Caballeronia insecticola]|uniref:Histone family protein nucleoid-structuring protein H-NS n=1 Tax=Caballeronia insecticola TaxID=758793 RepID=R4X3C3_9BURK|nr:H-NS histone family protein [Caballeronia insecticola]BAN27311.1 histone family protein nucleoid-structuring protein H-NS [Caballeronia insecticola]
MATLSQLENQIQKLQRRADALREKKSTEAIANIQALMAEYGLTTADLAKAGLGKKRGRPAGSTNASASRGKTAAKSKLPPKYRDPATGATWSGHARPPAWIKDASDRSVFLIDSPATGSVARGGAASASRAASAKGAIKGATKGAAKKTARKSVQRASA